MKMENTKEFAGKRVLIIVENLPLPFDRRVWQEATALKENGADVHIICPRGKGHEQSYELLEDIHIYRHWLPTEGDGALGYLYEYSMALIMEFLLATKIYLKGSFDVIQGCNPPDLIFLVALPFKLLGKKFVFDHHDISPELYIAKFGKKDFFYKLMLFFEKITFKMANLSIATNDSYKKIAINRGGKKEEDVFVVRSGPSFSRLKRLPPDKSIKNGKKFLVGYIGVIGKQEGLEYLIDAAYYIINKLGREDVYFICIGGGTELETVITYAKIKGLENHFKFTGRISDEEMLKILNTADVCVNPDEYNEMNDKSTMNKIMEYMALGKPIVQFDLTEGKYSAKDASLYAEKNDSIDFGDKIIELLDDEEKRTYMGEYGFQRVKNKFEWEYEKEKLFEVYRKLFDT